MVVERRFSYEKGTKASDREATPRRFPLRPGLHEEIRRRLDTRLHLEERIREIRRARKAEEGQANPGPGRPACPSGCEAMGKDELIVELMRRDMEVARLKKATR